MKKLYYKSCNDGKSYTPWKLVDGENEYFYPEDELLTNIGEETIMYIRIEPDGIEINKYIDVSEYFINDDGIPTILGVFRNI